MHIDEIKQNLLINIFCEIAQIPSPSMGEEKVIDWIKNFCKTNNLDFELDDYKNVYIKVGAENPDKQTIMLSAHMDVVGDFSPVNLTLDGDFIKTDGKRTLGADNKAGVACALMLAKEISQSDFEHGGLEIVLTRDEEHGMSGVKHVDFKKLNSKYILVLDADKLGQILTAGSNYNIAELKVKTTYGGHSALDIGDEKRLNAAKLISELICKIPQGVFYKDETGVITSINLGTVIGGNIQNSTTKIVSENIKTDNYLDYFIENAITNVINTEAQASYSTRSLSLEKENELKDIIKKEIDEFNAKYKDLAHAQIEFKEHLPLFQKTNDNLIETLHAKACQKFRVPQIVSFTPAGAETHIYGQNCNSIGENFIPFLLGTSDIYNMHSNEEKINYQTLLQGYEILKELFINL